MLFQTVLREKPCHIDRSLTTGNLTVIFREFVGVTIFFFLFCFLSARYTARKHFTTSRRFKS